MAELNFDIESTSKEDGATITHYRDEEKRRIIQKIRNSTGMKVGDIVQQLANGTPLQTCFFIYRKK